MASENKLQDIIQTSLENMRNLVDANTIIGTPIETASGTTLIPVSKISVGLATGGLDGSSAHPDKPVFGGGGGTGMSIKPVAFMIVWDLDFSRPFLSYARMPGFVQVLAGLPVWVGVLLDLGGFTLTAG